MHTAGPSLRATDFANRDAESRKSDATDAGRRPFDHTTIDREVVVFPCSDFYSLFACIVY